jgi:site-specific DNA-methyltransferase (adenine-specific)
VQKANYSTEQQCIEHILKNQIFGDAVSLLSSLVSRRSLYCSKSAQSNNSLIKFDSEEGNIFFAKVEHSLKNGKCQYCGIKESNLESSHDSSFLHGRQFNEANVVITSPPFQVFDGGGLGSSATPVYHRYVQTIFETLPALEEAVFLIPSRWINGGKGLDDFREFMASFGGFRLIRDYPDSLELINSVKLAGGLFICHWKSGYRGKTTYEYVSNGNVIETQRDMRTLSSSFVRDPLSLSIIKKIEKNYNRKLSESVRPRNYYKIPSNYESNVGNVLVYGSRGIQKIDSVKLVGKDITKYKVVLSKASNESAGKVDANGQKRVFAKIEILEPHMVCTESYIVMYENADLNLCKGFRDYLKSKILRFLVNIVLPTQNISTKSFVYVPDWYPGLDYSYEALGLTEKEINYVELTIREH